MAQTELEKMSNKKDWNDRDTFHAWTGNQTLSGTQEDLPEKIR